MQSASAPPQATISARDIFPPRPPAPIVVREKRRGFASTLMGATALILVGAAGSFAGLTYAGSYERWRLHTAAVHPDQSQIDVGPKRRIRDADVLLSFKDEAGRTRHVLARHSATAQFANETIAFLDAEQARIKADLKRDIALLVDAAFADRDQSIEAFADWNFAMGRSWRVLLEGVSAAITHIPKAAVSKETLQEAVRHEVEAYFMRHYKQFVLKADLRDPVLVKGFEAALLRAHASYLRTTANVDLRLQLFLAQQTELLDPGRAAEVRTLKLDWNAQTFKAPRFGLEDHAMSALWRGTQFVGVTALVAKTIGPAIEAKLVAIFASVGGRVMSALAPQMKATIAGTTFGGPLAGWLSGVAVGIGADWLVTTAVEKFERPQFVDANRAAVASTMAVWTAALTERADAAVDIWFADTRALVAIRKLPLNRKS